MTKPAGHTPGPWRIVDGGFGGLLNIFPEDGHQAIASVWPSVAKKFPIPTEANARLIAAAPDLLSVLETWTDERMINAGHLPTSFVRDAKQAIAKARGEI